MQRSVICINHLYVSAEVVRQEHDYVGPDEYQQNTGKRRQESCRQETR